jgi:hypothetical protein
MSVSQAIREFALTAGHQLAARNAPGKQKFKSLAKASFALAVRSPNSREAA